MHDIITLGIFVAGVVVLTPLLAAWLYHTVLLPNQLCQKIGQPIFVLLGLPQHEQTVGLYTRSLLSLALLSVVALWAILLSQYYLPYNPSVVEGLPWYTALNVAISFATSTNWQVYAGESQLSPFSQMIGLTVQNFISAGTGLAVLMAFIRGMVRQNASTIGNFWQDMFYSVTCFLVPLSIIFSLLAIQQGSPQTFVTPLTISTIETGAAQVMPLGAVASQVAIKIIGGNGGGYFNANSVHPFETPTPLVALLHLIIMLALPAACFWLFAKAVGRRQLGVMLLLVCTALFSLGLVLAYFNEHVNGTFNWEGKDIRFGSLLPILWSAGATATSNGSVLSSLQASDVWALVVYLGNILAGELIFGGVGLGTLNMLVYLLLTVFLAGLMIGRTPDFLGKKINPDDLFWVLILIAIPTVLVLGGLAVTLLLPAELLTTSQTGVVGFVELSYAMASATFNNGSALGGLSANNIGLTSISSVQMLLGRLLPIIALLHLAGNFAGRTINPVTPAHDLVHQPVMMIFLSAVIIINLILSYLPMLLLGVLNLALRHF